MTERLKIKSLELRDLDYVLNDESPVFSGVSFKFPMQGIGWVTSVSGGGKSSLFRILDGLSFPSGGQYLLNGKAVEDMSFDEFNQFRLNIGYSFDFGGMINNRTLFQNLSLPLEYHKLLEPSEIHERVHGLLGLFGIDPVADLRPSAVPGAIRKAMCVARAFVHKPQIILLDDPTTGLRKEIKPVLKSIVSIHRKQFPESLILVATDDKSLMEDIYDFEIKVKRTSIECKATKEKAA